jgi:hypothetical protein
MSKLAALRVNGAIKSVSTETVYLPGGKIEQHAIVVSDVITDPVNPNYDEEEAQRLSNAVGEWWEANSGSYDRLVVKRTWEA